MHIHPCSFTIYEPVQLVPLQDKRHHYTRRTEIEGLEAMFKSASPLKLCTTQTIEASEISPGDAELASRGPCQEGADEGSARADVTPVRTGKRSSDSVIVEHVMYRTYY